MAKKRASFVTKLRRNKPTMLRLEPRLMFDGAGAVDAVTVLGAEEIAHYIAPPAVDETELAETNHGATDFVLVDLEAREAILDFLAESDAMDKLFATFNGNQTEPSAEWWSKPSNC
jgi:hypothetical protein